MSKLEDELAFHFKAHKLDPKTEYTFYPGRRWRFDFAFPDKRLAIETEGGIWSGGRHTRGQGYENDCTKYNCAVIQGWRVLRFTGRQVRSGEAIQTILEALK